MDRLLILGAASAAAIGLVQVALLPTDPALTMLVADRVSLTFLAIGTLGAVPLAFAMPLVRGRFFGRMWRGPRLAFILPHWLVRLMVGVVIGQFAAVMTAAVLRDYRIFWLAGLQALVGGGFGAGAWLRFRQRSDAGWGVRRWPRM